MKITVGQILLVAGVGTYVLLGPTGALRKAGPALDGVREFAAEKVPFMEGLKKKKPKAKKPALPTLEVSPEIAAAARMEVEDKMPAAEDAAPAPNADFAEVPLTPVPAAATNNAPVAEAAPKREPARSVAETPKAAPKASRRRRKPTSPAVAAAPAPRKAAKKPAAEKSKDALVGTYVALTLKTGNVVKGVLLERTAASYKVELPGMGGFDYPADSVKSVAAAE